MRILELFAGYGSQALALENLGIPFTSDISEIDRYAIQAYEQLHGATHNWGDICKIDETKLPYYDLITYSSPCQDFSAAGLGRGGDAGSGTRSSLLWQCERIIRAVKPKYLLMENVKNLVGEKHKRNFIKWLKVLESIGYQNFWKVLNAKDYGVPQNRERVFVVSILGGGQYLFPNPIKLEKRLKDILEPKVEEKYFVNNDKTKQIFDRYKKLGFLYKDIQEPSGVNLEESETFSSPPMAGLSRCLKALNTDAGVIQVGNIVHTGNWDNPERGRIYSDEGVSPALSTMQGGGLESKILKNYRIRKLTPRECWRLMGVKDEQFDKLHDISNSQLYKLAGNSIVVDVMMGIFRNLLLSDEGTNGQLTLL